MGLHIIVKYLIKDVYLMYVMAIHSLSLPLSYCQNAMLFLDLISPLDTEIGYSGITCIL